MDISILKQMQGIDGTIKDPSDLYPIDELNPYGLVIFLNSSIRMGSQNNNVEIATVDPTIWMSNVLDMVLEKFSYASHSPRFSKYELKSGTLFSTILECDIEKFNTEEELIRFFDKYDNYSTLVIFSCVKYVDLSKLITTFVVSYKDITDSQTKRDRKLESIIN